MADPNIFEFFAALQHYPFLQRALLAGVVVAAVAAVLGVFVVLRNMSMIGDGLAHSAFGGVGFSLFAAGYAIFLTPLQGALLFAVSGGLIISLLVERRLVGGDTALGIVFSLGLGLGVVFISVAGKGLGVDIFSFLFGNILTVSVDDLGLIVVMAAAIGVVLAVFYQRYTAIAFDPESAQVLGIPVSALNTLLNVLTAITVVIAMKVVGVLLVSALMIVPPATALQIGRRLPTVSVLAVLLAMLAVFVGLLCSYVFDVATGGAVALVSLGVFLAVSMGRWLRPRNEGHAHAPLAPPVSKAFQP